MLICGFDFRNFVYVFQTDGPQNFVARFRRSLLYAGCLLYKIGGRWSFGYEMESAVWFDSDEGWRGYTWLYVSGSRVELLTEVHRLDAFGTQSWANWWCWGRFPRSDEEALEYDYQSTVIDKWFPTHHNLSSSFVGSFGHH